MEPADWCARGRECAEGMNSIGKIHVGAEYKDGSQTTEALRMISCDSADGGLLERTSAHLMIPRVSPILRGQKCLWNSLKS